MSRFRNSGAHIRCIEAIPPSAYTNGTTNGAAIDRYGLGGDAQFSGVLVAHRGTETGGPSTDTSQFSVQHSADGSTGWAALNNPNTGSAYQSTAMAAPGLEQIDLDLSGAHRYIRVVLVTTLAGGASPTIPASATISLSGELKAPLA